MAHHILVEFFSNDLVMYRLRYDVFSQAREHHENGLDTFDNAAVQVSRCRDAAPQDASDVWAEVPKPSARAAAVFLLGDGQACKASP